MAHLITLSIDKSWYPPTRCIKERFTYKKPSFLTRSLKKIIKMKIFLSIILVFTSCYALPVEEIPTEVHQYEQLVPEPQPAFNAQRDVRFLLFTRLNPTIGQQSASKIRFLKAARSI